jgi:hypothetical protein
VGRGGADALCETGQARSELTAQHCDFVAQDQISMSLAAVLPANSLSQPNIVTEIRYSSRNSTARDHVMLT